LGLRLVSDFHSDNEDNTGKESGDGKFSQPLDIATDSSGSVNPAGIAIYSSGNMYVGDFGQKQSYPEVRQQRKLHY